MLSADMHCVVDQSLEKNSERKEGAPESSSQLQSFTSKSCLQEPFQLRLTHHNSVHNNELSESERK